jgi:hypothetical protein
MDERYLRGRVRLRPKLPQSGVKYPCLAALAQSAGRDLPKVEVTGSNPVCCSESPPSCYDCPAVSLVGRWWRVILRRAVGTAATMLG